MAGHRATRHRFAVAGGGGSSDTGVWLRTLSTTIIFSRAGMPWAHRNERSCLPGAASLDVVYAARRVRTDAAQSPVANLRPAGRAGNAEEQRGLALVASGVPQRGPDMASLGGVERLGGGQRRPLGDHEIGGGRDLRWHRRRTVVHRHVPALPKGIAQCDDIVALRVADEEQDVKRTHRSKVQQEATLGDMLDLAQLTSDTDARSALLTSQSRGRSCRTILVLASDRTRHRRRLGGRDEMVRGLAKGMIVQVVGKVTTYRDAMQLDVTSVRPLPRGSVPLVDLVPSVGPVDRYWQYLDETRTRITAPRLRAVLDCFYADDSFRLAYEQCPGSPGSGHHAALGGLLQHTTEVVRIGVAMARVARACGGGPQRRCCTTSASCAAIHGRRGSSIPPKRVGWSGTWCSAR